MGSPPPQKRPAGSRGGYSHSCPLPRHKAVAPHTQHAQPPPLPPPQVGTADFRRGRSHREHSPPPPHPHPESPLPAQSNRRNSVPPPHCYGVLWRGECGGNCSRTGGERCKGGWGGALMGLPPVQKQRHRINRGTGMGGGGEGGSRGGGVGAQTGAPNCSPTPQQRPSPASSSPGYPTSVCLCLSVCPPSAPWCSVDVIVDAGGVGGGRFGLLLLAGAQPRGAAHQPQVGLLLLGLTGLGVVGTGFGRG